MKMQKRDSPNKNKQGGKGKPGIQQQQDYETGNIFHDKIIKSMDSDPFQPYREKKRPNLYNVIKRLREEAVSNEPFDIKL